MADLRSCSWLIFEVDTQFRFAIPAACVAEIIPSLTLTSLPACGRFADGVANIRGEFITIVNMRRAFSLTEQPIQLTDHFIIVRGPNGQKVGLRVDRAIELTPLSLAPKTAGEHAAVHIPFVTTIATHRDEPIMVHDLQELLAVVTTPPLLTDKDREPQLQGAIA